MVHDLFHHGHHAIRIKGVGRGHGHAAFVTAPPEGFRQAVEAAVDALVAQGHRRFRHLCALGNLARQLLVPELPAQPAGQFAGNASAAAAKFAFQSDDAKHGAPPSQSSAGRDPGSHALLYDDLCTTASA